MASYLHSRGPLALVAGLDRTAGRRSQVDGQVSAGHEKEQDQVDWQHGDGEPPSWGFGGYEPFRHAHTVPRVVTEQAANPVSRTIFKEEVFQALPWQHLTNMAS